MNKSSNFEYTCKIDKMIQLCIASNNDKKIKEIKEILNGIFEVKSMKEMGFDFDIPETGKTIEENSKLKAEFIHTKYGIATLSDDSGLEVQTLNNEPGVNSARYAGAEKDDKKNIKKLLTKLVMSQNRKARFKTVITLAVENKFHQFEGIIEGNITYEEKGQNGFGYDSIFIPEGYITTFAEMSNEEKNKISHRKKAIEKLEQYIKKGA